MTADERAERIEDWLRQPHRLLMGLVVAVYVVVGIAAVLWGKGA